VSEAKVGARRAFGRGGWWRALALSTGLASGTSCLGPNEGHCIYAGGDLACESSGMMCVFAPMGGSAEGVRNDGCFEGAELPDEFFHAKYGLPARLEARQGDPMDITSVEGLLLRLTDGERAMSEDALEELSGVFQGVKGYHTRLTQEGKLLEAKYDVGIEPFECPDDAREMDKACAYYRVIDDWLMKQPPSTDTETETSSDTETTGATLDATATSTGDTGPECSNCPEEKPFCGPNLQCATCNEMPDPDGACTSMDSATPFCEGVACVQCTAERPEECMGDTPVCGVSNTCVPCTAHAQCASGGCELGKGTCFPGDAEAVIHVDGDGGQDFLTVSMAVGSIGGGADGVIMVHELNGGVSYQESVVIDGGKAIVLLAAPGETPVLLGTGGNPGLRVGGSGTTLYMEGLSISGGPVEGLVVTNAFAWIDRSRVVNNIGGGIVVEGSTAEVIVRNSFVGVNVNNVPAMALNSGVTATVSYSTIVGAFGTAATGLTCAADSTLVARDTIILSLNSDSPVSCIMGTFEHVASDAMLPGGTNSEIEDFGIGSDWFVDANNGDFHLQNEGLTLFDNVGEWNDGDPLTDIDGEERAQPDGASDYAGADVP